MLSVSICLFLLSLYAIPCETLQRDHSEKEASISLADSADGRTCSDIPQVYTDIYPFLTRFVNRLLHSQDS